MRNFSANNLIYSYAAVRRVLGLKINHPIEVRVWAKVLWVCAEGFRPTFISKKVLLSHFAEWRKENSAPLVVSQIDNSKYWIASSDGKTRYQTYVSGKTTCCTCKDYEMQHLAFSPNSKKVCKHLYATLNFIGYSSFSEYITAA
jgi:SWIM zinc finger